MSPLRAAVRRVTGHTKHHTLVNGNVTPMKPAAVVRIVDDGSGCYLLLRFDEGGRGITDTWHATLAEAKRQAFVEYEINASDWTVETN